MTDPNAVSTHSDLQAVVAKLGGLAERFAAAADGLSCATVVAAAVDMTPGAKWGSLTVREDGGYRSLAASDDFTRRIDALQYEVGAGPCLAAISDGSIQVSSDLADDTRWRSYPQLAAAHGVRSVLAYRLYLWGQDRSRAALNLYSDEQGVFDDATVRSGAMVASYAEIAVSYALSHEKSEQLEAALRTNREIATAVGVIMGRYGASRESAMELLRLISQTENRRIAAIAADVVSTGDVHLPERLKSQITPTKP